MMSDLLDERALVAQARAGDRDAFDRLVRRHFRRVYAALFRLVGNHEDAEDLAQESFVRAFASLEHYRGDGAFVGWVLRIAVHLAQDHFRKRGRGGTDLSLADLSLEPDVPARGPAQEVGRRELGTKLGEALDKLPAPLRTAITLRVLEGLAYADVARATGTKPGTARTQVMKARRMLLRWMAPWLGDGGEA